MFSFCVLGSGSRGNSTLLVMRDDEQERHILIDCGLSPRATAKRMAELGVKVADVSEIWLTHLDGDHFRQGWTDVAERFDITVRLHQRHRNRAVQLGLSGRQMELFREPFPLGRDAHAEPVLFAHDALGTVGYVVEHAGLRFGLATDLGRVPDGLDGRYVDLDALAIESNYDRALQVASDRPDHLKRRIMGGQGHLSNEQSIDAVAAIDARSRLRHVVPLHLSRQCNDARLVKKLYAERLPHLLEKLTVSSQDEPTPMLDVGGPAPAARPGQQLGMFT
ncbi:MAG: MBL fold metallo-hydrolase [Planctomycetes bacterium]|nr:MBL fold metallo-hydrolase [Planctomycetota bacterium]